MSFDFSVPYSFKLLTARNSVFKNLATYYHFNNHESLKLRWLQVEIIQISVVNIGRANYYRSFGLCTEHNWVMSRLKSSETNH